MRQSGYTFINPLLECENNDSFAKQKYIPFERITIERINNEVTLINSGVTLAVYFRNLNNGPWFGINEEEKFPPASLMKMTILMAYLKWSESEKDLLQKTITVETLSNLIQKIIPQKKIESGKNYTIKELLYYLIAYSDNTAGNMLLANIPPPIQEKVFTDLGIPMPGRDLSYSLSVKEYASFFRILYNASYLSKESSEE
jgi:beta-lactamase class A